MDNTEESPTRIIEYEHKIQPKYKALVIVIIGMFGTIAMAWILGVPFAPVMDNIQGSFWYHLLPFLFSITVFGVLVYRAYIQKIRGLAYLSSAVLLHGVAELLFTISNPSGSILNRGDNLLAMIGDLMFPIAVILIYLHIEFIEKLRPNLIHAIGIIGTAVPMVIGGIILILLRPQSFFRRYFFEVINPLEFIDFDFIYSEVQKVVFVYLGLFALVILWISLFGFRIMYGTLYHADSPEVARSSSFVLIGFASLLTNFILLGVSYTTLFTDNPLIFGNADFVIYNTWLVTFALISLLLAYILTPQFAYSVNFDVYQLIIINQIQGITLYSFINEIRQEGGLTHDALKSPAIVAIQNLVQEIAQAEGHIIIIGMSDRIIVMKNHKEIVSVLITEKNSYFLNHGLEDFTNAFYKKYEEHIVNFRGNVKVFRSADDLVRQHLPFMRTNLLNQTKQN